MIVQVIYFHKIQTKLFQMQVFTVNAYKQLSLMSVNGKYDVIKGPVLPPVLRLVNRMYSDKIFGKTFV